MLINLSDANINLLIATMAAISSFLSVVLVSWPYLMPDTLGARMKKVKEEREAIRRRERSRLLGKESPSLLRAEPKKIFKDILDRLNLGEELNNTRVVKKLRMAGYHGQSPVVTFLAVQIIIPGVLFIVARECIGCRSQPIREIRHLSRSIVTRAGAGNQRQAHERGRKKGGRPAAETDSAYDPVFSADPIRRHYDPGAYPGVRPPVRR
jgi:hypothetical protein